ncbi:MAG TPA: lipocalin-like domain-containing protein [Victivallales bacterium]|nr:lipocalin-like domain-containing protein [Victivallales bacterium]
MDRKIILGAWRLSEWYMEDKSGDVYHPFGKEVDGFIMYTSDYYMSANIVALSRKNCISEGVGLESLHQGKGSYLSYSGSYTLYKDRVIHHVKVSLIPEWINNDQERFYKIQDNKLIINSFTEKSDKTVFKHTLVWEKCCN